MVMVMLSGCAQRLVPLSYGQINDFVPNCRIPYEQITLLENSRKSKWQEDRYRFPLIELKDRLMGKDTQRIAQEAKIQNGIINDKIRTIKEDCGLN